MSENNISKVKIKENLGSATYDENRLIGNANYENKDETKSSNSNMGNLEECQETEIEIEKEEQSQLINTKLCTTSNAVLNNEVILDKEVYRISNSTINDDIIIENNRVSRIPPNWKQFISASGAITLYFAAGMSSGYSATLLPHLREEHSAILQSESSASWIAAIGVLPLAPCCFIGGCLIEKFGRRRTLSVLGIPVFISWIVITLSTSFTQMLLGRFINGCCSGILMPSMSVFISESSSPKLRDMLLTLLPFSFAFATFVSHIVGTCVSWQWTAILSSIFPLISVVIFLFVPESPVWLLSKGKIDDGIKAFHWLRGRDDNARLELNAMLDKFKSSETSSSTRHWRENLNKFKSPEFLRPLFIIITIYLTSHLSGVHTIIFYSVDIMEKATGGGINRYVAMLTIDALRTMTTLVAVFFSKNCPRRILLILSGSLAAASMLGLSIFLFFNKGTLPSHLTAVPLCFFSAFIMSVNIGLVPLPVIVVGEIFPASIRSFGAGISSSIGLFAIFLGVKTAPGMMTDFGQVFTFSCYGIITLIGTIILFFILPETKGKSLLEIEEIFKSKRQNTL